MCVFSYALDKLKLNSAIVNGNGHKFNGGGPFYWVNPITKIKYL